MATATAPSREDFAKMLDEAFGGGNLQEGSVIKGKVVGVEKEFAVIDVGLKTEGRVALREFAGPGRQADLKVGDEVTLEVDHARRTATRAHHSATHLLHEALRQVLGTHVAQKGSLVEPGRLRFDFSHPKPMTHEEIRAVEDMVNAMILQNEPVETHLMTPEAAISQGALALFGEKYAEEVRVVSMGKSDKSTRAQHAYSIELCGGTHVRATGEIGAVRVTQIEKKGKQNRRVRLAFA